MQHKLLLLAATFLVFTLALWPAEQATAQKTTESLVVTEYAELAVGKEYPLPLDLTEEEQELAETFTETRQVKIKNGDTSIRNKVLKRSKKGKKYCGTQDTVPPGYRKRGDRYSCLKKGYGLGMMITKEKYFPSNHN